MNKQHSQKDEKHFQKYGVYPEEIEKKDEKFKLTHIKKFLPYFKGEGFKFACIIFCFLILIAVNVGATYVVNMAVENLYLSEFTKALIFWAVVTAMFIFAQLVWLINSTISCRLFNRVIKKIRYDLTSRVLSTKMTQFDSVSSGDILNRINVDPERFCDGIPVILSQIHRAIIYIGRLAIFFTFSVWMGLYLVCACIGLYIVAVVFSKNITTPAVRRRVKIVDKLTNVTTEMTRGIRDLKCLNLEKVYLNKVEHNLEYSKNSFNSESLARNSMDSVFDFVARCFWIASKCLGIFLITKGMFTVANIITLTTYEDGIYMGVGRLGYVKDTLNRMEVSARRMDEIMCDYPQEKFGSKKLENPKGTIEFNKVNFDYGEQKIFDNLNFKVNAGECVGIVGRSGEGKSTILSLIPKLYDLKSGSIQIDGIDVAKLNQESLRNTISFVSQSPYIFNVSIKENLLFANPDATQEEMENACRKAELHDFIISKPDGYDTLVGEGGIALSGGQRQRLAIARALLRNSKILLLDEATSALDNLTQQKIKQTIANLGHDYTIIVVAHRLSTVVDCDKIYVLANHQIEAEGTHQELLKISKSYRKLYEEETNQ